MCVSDKTRDKDANKSAVVSTIRTFHNEGALLEGNESSSKPLTVSHPPLLADLFLPATRHRLHHGWLR